MSVAMRSAGTSLDSSVYDAEYCTASLNTRRIGFSVICTPDAVTSTSVLRGITLCLREKPMSGRLTRQLVASTETRFIQLLLSLSCTHRAPDQHSGAS